jgi:hypothetical protein
MEFKGVWDAATNTPTLVNGTGNAGDVWLCNVAGTVNFGAGPIAFAVGDYAVYTGTVWARSSGATGTVTSVGVSRDGNALTITGSPVTTSGTINLGFSGDNTQYINGAGNLTTFPTLITSIGLTMPAAFGVSNSPLTANGTIGVTALGYPSQYIRGDGTLADFPTSGGGGSSVSYYFNGGTSQGTIGGTTYYEMSKTADTGTGVDFNKTGDGFIVAFLTDANDPNLLQIPAGNWDFEIYASMSSNGGTPELYAELYKYDGTTFTLIATSSHEILYDGVNLNLYSFATAVPQTSLTVTDRLAIKLYADNSGGKTTTIHTQDSHLCQVITTFSTGLTALNGLTAQVQYFGTGTSGSDFNIVSSVATHTFNIPSASATARGLITTGTQTIAGSKTITGTTTFTGGPILSDTNLTYSNSGYTLVLQSPTLSVNRTVTLPNGTGTLALTSDISYPVTSVFGRTGAVVATSGDYNSDQVTEGTTNLYFTNARARTAISLTTTGSTGASTYNNTTGVLNIPNYVDQYVGTVTSVGLSAPTGFSVSGSPVTSSGTLALSFASGYSLPTNVKQSNWDDAYTWVAAFPTQTGNSGKFLTTDGSSLSWAANPLGTVTSVAMSVPTGLSVSGSPITSSGTLAVTLTAGYVIPTQTTLDGKVPYSGATGAVTLGIYSLTATGITVSKSSGISTITFPAGTNDPAYIQHEESTSDTGIMRFSVSDNNLTNDYFVFGNTEIGTFVERFKILATGVVTIGTWQGTAIADAYIASAATWNAKQGAITLTTTGTSGAATFSSNTLNIPNYGSALSGYLPLTGGTLTGPLLGTSANFSSTIIGQTFATNTVGYYSQFDYSSGTRIIQNSPDTEVSDSMTFVINGGSTSTTGNAFIFKTQSGNTTPSAVLTILKTGNATFSSNLTLSNGALTLNRTNGNAQLYFLNNGASDWDLGTQVGDATQNFALYNRGTSTQAFYINKSNNGAFFSGTISASNLSGTNTGDQTLAGLGGVPYTGATTDVNLGTRALSAGNILGVTLSASQTSNTQSSLVVSNAGTFRIADFNNSGALVAYITNSGSIYGSSFVKSGGGSNQFLKADGSVDSTSYQSAITLTTTGTSGASTFVSNTLNIPNYSGSYLPLSGGTLTGNLYIQSTGNPTQLLVKGTNSEFWVDSTYGGGTARSFVNRGTTGNQATLMFTTGVVITNGTAWAGSGVDFSMGTTNDASGNFYIGAGDIYSSSNRAITITSTKSIGIGTSTINGGSKLQVDSANGTAYSSNSQLRVSSGGVNNNRAQILFSDNALSDGKISYYPASSTNAYFSISARTTENDFIINGLGNVGINCTPSQKLEVAGQVRAESLNCYGTSNPASTSPYIYSPNGNDFGFGCSGAARVFISSGGNFSIGTPTSRPLSVEASTSGSTTFFHNTSNTSGTRIATWQLGGSNTNNTSSYYLFCDTDSVGVLMVVYGNGNVANVNNSYGAYSDIKLKENIVDATPKLDDLLKVKIRNFNLKGSDIKQIGVIAQELEEIFPSMIEESNDTIKDKNGENIENGEKTKSVKYSVFVPMLIKAIQEQQEQINKLKQLIN